MSKETSFVLVHSPLVGPFTWSLVAKQLEEQGYHVRIPALSDQPGSSLPYWKQHSQVPAAALKALPPGTAPILVGHSGAGPLLPAIAQAAGRGVVGYIFVDAGLPHPGKSRLQEMEETNPHFAQSLREYLAIGALYPNWTDKLLAPILPDESLRAQLLKDINPRSLAFFEEKLPEVPSFPDAPCAYLLLSPAYEPFLASVKRLGWTSRAFDTGHFQMLVDPPAVAESLIELAHTF